MKIPSFSHAFLDFFISSQIIRSQKKWYLSSPHVGETNEDREFRKVRAIQRDVLGDLNSLELVNYLDKYAETGNEYIKILKKIIEQNKLTDFDDAKILPNSNKEKGLI